MSGLPVQLTAVAALSFVLGACRDAPSAAVLASAIRVDSPAERSVLVADTFRITAVVVDARGNALPDARVGFRSDRPEVASVDSMGLVTPHGPGTAEITAFFRDLRSAVRLHVSWGALGELALETPPGGVIRADMWALSPSYVHFTARSAASGTSVCGQVPLQFQSDSSVAVAVYAPLPGDPCTIRIVPRGQGRTTLTVTGPGMSASADVEVTSNRYWFGLEREDGRAEVAAMPGSTVRYRVTVLDETGRPVAGLALLFSGSPGRVRPETASTDSAGTASTAWTLPNSRAAAWLSVTAPDGRVTYAQARQALKDARDFQWRFERDEGSPETPALAGSTVRYRVTALDDTGQPIPGVTVYFSGWPGDVRPQGATTNSAGIASVDWTLPWSGSTATLYVRAPDDWSTYAQVQQALKRIRWRLEREDGSAEVSLPPGSTVRYRVTALDEAGGPVSGLQIRFTGFPGTVNPTSAATDATGTASVAWTLPGPGSFATLRVLAAFANVVYAEVNQAQTRYRLSIDRENGALGEPAVVGTTLRYSFTATDEEGTPVAGVRLDLQASGALSDMVAITDAAGGASVAWTLRTRLTPNYPHPYLDLSRRATLSVSGTWPDGSHLEAADSILLDPGAPAGFLILMAQNHGYNLRFPCHWHEVRADTVRPLASTSPDPMWRGTCEPLGIRIGVSDRYGNPVIDHTLPEVTADYPAALEGGSTVLFPPSPWSFDYYGLYVWSVASYPLRTTRASPWVQGLTLTLRLPGVPSVSPRTVTVIPWCSDCPSQTP
ncbi:MAG TPA: hypothetical protein VF746_00830 [Longimicrobium sp.]|jgi:hypothetical protein